MSGGNAALEEGEPSDYPLGGPQLAAPVVPGGGHRTKPAVFTFTVPKEPASVQSWLDASSADKAVRCPDCQVEEGREERERHLFPILLFPRKVHKVMCRLSISW